MPCRIGWPGIWICTELPTRANWNGWAWTRWRIRPRWCWWNGPNAVSAHCRRRILNCIWITPVQGAAPHGERSPIGVSGCWRDWLSTDFFLKKAGSAILARSEEHTSELQSLMLYPDVDTRSLHDALTIGRPGRTGMAGPGRAGGAGRAGVGGMARTRCLRTAGGGS